MTPIVYFNVLFCLFADTDAERYKINVFEQMSRSGKNKLTMQALHDWCRRQEISYKSRFFWRVDYPAIANIHNFLTYVRFLITRG